MKKEFIDFMYEQRALIQTDIDQLVEKRKLPTDGSCEGCGNEIEAELRTRRSQIQGVNKAIEKYFEVHSKNI